jgi:hypothetical protein
VTQKNCTLGVFDFDVLDCLEGLRPVKQAGPQAVTLIEDEVLAIPKYHFFPGAIRGYLPGIGERRTPKAKVRDPSADVDLVQARGTSGQVRVEP